MKNINSVREDIIKAAERPGVDPEWRETLMSLASYIENSSAIMRGVLPHLQRSKGDFQHLLRQKNWSDDLREKMSDTLQDIKNLIVGIHEAVEDE